MTLFDDYETFNLELVRIFTAEDFRGARALAEAHQGRFPEQRAEFDYMRMCIAVRTEEIDAAYAIFQQALDDGLWWSEELLINSPSLLPLLGQRRFEELLAQSEQMGRAELALLDRLILDRPDQAVEPLPLLVGLHDNSSDARDAKRAWAPVKARGVLCALPQAREALLKGAYAWDNFDRTMPDVEQIIAELERDHGLDPDRIILGGHGMGAQLALWMAISSARAYRGVIAVAPFLSWMELDWWEDQFAALQRPGLRGLILYGTADEALAPEALHQVAERLQQTGSACRIEAVEGAGHSFGSAFQERVLHHWDWLIGAQD